MFFPLARLLVAAALLTYVLPAADAMAAPVNDAFSSAIIISGTNPSVLATTTGATKESGEPDHLGQNKSVWYRWTPTTSGGAHVTGSCSVSRVAVYTGAWVGGLTSAGAGGNCTGDARFMATAGVTYRIAVDAQTGAAPGPVVVTLTQVTQKPNFGFGSQIPALTPGIGQVSLVEATGAKSPQIEECMIDGSTAHTQCFFKDGAWVFYWSGLTTGKHTAKITVRDWYGNVDPTPLVKTWTVDATPPETSVTAPAPSEASTVPVSFSADESSVTFECSLEGGPWQACASPTSFPNTSLLGYQLRVRAFDAVGNGDSTPAWTTWSRPAKVYPPKAVTPPPVNPVRISPTTTTPSTPPTIVPHTAPAPPKETCKLVVTRPASLTRAALRKGITIKVATNRTCRFTVSLRRAGRSAHIARFSGAGTRSGVLKVGPVPRRSIFKGTKLELLVQSYGRPRRTNTQLTPMRVVR